MPPEFITICGISFITGMLTTAYFFYSMGLGMKMPGGWTMSMMWMRMPGQTWFASMISYTLMLLAMMLAIMMPSAHSLGNAYLCLNTLFEALEGIP